MLRRSTILTLLKILFALGVITTPSLGQTLSKSQSISARSRIIDLRYEAWLESKGSFYELESICTEFAAVGQWKKVAKLVDKANLSHQGDTEDKYRISISNDIYQGVALYLAQNRSITEALTYLHKHVTQEDADENKEETVTDGICEVASRLATKGDVRSLQLLKSISWSERPIVWGQGTEIDRMHQRSLEDVVGSLAAAGRIENALAAIETIEDQSGKNDLMVEVFGGAVGNLPHDVLQQLYERIKSPEIKTRAIHLGFVCAGLLDYKKKIEAADKLFSYCERFGKSHPYEKLKLVASACAEHFEEADRQRAFQIAKSSFSDIPENHRRYKDAQNTFVDCHIRLGQFKRAIELAGSFQLDDDFLVRSYSSICPDRFEAKKIVEKISTEQLAKIIEVVPGTHPDQLEFLALLLTGAAEARNRTKLNVIVSKILAIEQIEIEKIRFRNCEYALNTGLNRMLDEKANTQMAIDLARHLNRLIKQMSLNEFWSRIAITAYRSGQLKEYEFCLGQLNAEDQSKTQLMAIFDGKDREKSLRQVDLFLSGKAPYVNGLTEDQRLEFIMGIVASRFILAENSELCLATWEKVYDRFTAFENKQLIGSSVLSFRNARVRQPMACLAFLERVESLGGRDARIQIARCNANLWAGDTKAAKAIFKQLINSNDGKELIVSDFLVLFKKFADAQDYEPLELCLNKNIESALETALEHLSRRHLSAGNPDKAIDLADTIESPSVRADYLRELGYEIQKNSEANQRVRK